MHVRAVSHGFKGQNESCTELQNGCGLGPKEKVHIAREFDRFLGGILPVSRGD